MLIHSIKKPLKAEILPCNYEYEPPRLHAKPDLEVGATHKVRIQRQIDTGEYGIYTAKVLEVYDKYYVESVSFPATKDHVQNTQTRCFPKVDYRYGIDSCNVLEN